MVDQRSNVLTWPGEPRVEGCRPLQLADCRRDGPPSAQGSMTVDDPRIELALTVDELSILIGGLFEALYELDDQEFATRVGWLAEDARSLGKRLVDVRERYEAEG